MLTATRTQSRLLDGWAKSSVAILPTAAPVVGGGVFVGAAGRF